MNRLSILLGAGFSMPFGIPGVKALTDAAEAAVEPLLPTMTGSRSRSIPAARMLYRALRAEYGHVNFELALHAVESLISYAAADTFDEALADVRQVLRAFTEPSPRWGPLLHYDTLLRLRNAIIRQLVILISERENRVSRLGSTPHRVFQSSSKLFNSLANSFSLRCYTLNYDDVIDRHTNWNDGFHPAPPSVFSRKRFNRKLKYSEPLLCHLHGSTRFGFDEKGAIQKCVSVETALGSYQNELSNKINQAGELNMPGPIISGLRKLDKITSTPYGYYYSAFVNSVVADPRLLVIGYGFNDLHMDYWLSQHATIHGDDRRVVLVCKEPSRANELRRKSEADRRLEYPGLSRRLWRRGTRDAFTYHFHPRFSFFADSELMVVMSGYPLNIDGRAAVVNHLTS